MTKYKIKANEKIFNSWRDLGYDFSILVQHIAGLVQNDMELEHNEISEGFEQAGKIRAKIDQEFKALIRKTMEYIRDSKIK